MAATLVRLKVDKSNEPLLTFSVPETVRLAPSVVVPPLIVRLLKVVNTDDGRVLVAFKTTVPAPGVQVLVIVPPPVLTVKEPTVKVPPEVILIVLGVPGVALGLPKVKDEADKAAPAAKDKFPLRKPLPSPPTVTALPTAKEIPAAILTVPAPVRPLAAVAAI